MMDSLMVVVLTVFHFTLPVHALHPFQNCGPDYPGPCENDDFGVTWHANAPSKRVRRRIKEHHFLINTEMPQLVRLGWKKDNQFEDNSFGALVRVEHHVVVMTCRLCAMELMHQQKEKGQPYALFYGKQKPVLVLESDMHVKEPYKMDNTTFDLAIITLEKSKVDYDRLYSFNLPNKHTSDKEGFVAMVDMENEPYVVKKVKGHLSTKDDCEDPNYQNWKDGPWLCLELDETHGTLVDFGSPYFSSDNILHGMFTVKDHPLTNVKHNLQWIIKTVKSIGKQ